MTIHDHLKRRPLSWSAISSFEYNPSEWYKRYILNEKDDPTPAMTFGKEVGEKLATDPTFLPQVPRFTVFEKKLSVVFNKIPMIGYIDSYNPKTHAFLEYKTSGNKNRWTQKTAEEHGQLKFYCLCLFIMYKINPEDLDISLICLKTEQQGDFSVALCDPLEMELYKVKVTMADILNFGVRIKKTVGAMDEFIKSKELIEKE